MPNFAGSVALATYLINALYVLAINCITLSMIGCQFRITHYCSPRVIRCWCNRQYTADRPNTKNRMVIFCKHGHLLNGRSSSAWAKYADAFFRISLAWRSSPFPRSRTLRRALSSRLNPSRIPESRSACWHKPEGCPASNQALIRWHCKLHCRWNNYCGFL